MAKYNEEVQNLITNTIRQKVCEVGTMLIRKNGWTALTTENIAKEIGVSRSMLYNYFKNKEDIIHFILSNSVNELTQKLSSITNQNINHADKLIQMAKLVFDDFYNHRELHQAIRENIPMHKFINKEKKQHPRHNIHRAFEDIITLGIADGEFTKCNPQTASELLCGGIHAMCNHALFTQETQNVEELVNILLKGLNK